MSIFMRFYHTIQAIPAALTLLKRGAWAAWFCLAGARGRRFSAPFRRRVSDKSPRYRHRFQNGNPGRFSGRGIPAPCRAPAHRLLARLAGNIREGPD